MYYNRLGKTEKEISAIGFGAMRFLPEEYHKDLQICADILLYAHEQGINYFDTAPLYCEGLSEEIVGLAMRQIKGKRPFVSTKCNFRSVHTAKDAYEEILKSRDRLQVDTIDFYYMWSIRRYEQYAHMVRPGGVYEGMLRAKEDGLIGHICASLHSGGDEIARIAGEGKAESLILGYNATNFAYRRPGVKAAHENDLGIIIMNPLAGGLIPQHEDYFSFLKADENDRVTHAALRFLLGQKEVTSALVGFSSIKEVEDAVLAAKERHTITEEMLAEIAVKYGEEMNSLCTACAYCKDCPLGIPLVPLMFFYNEKILDPNTNFALKMRLQYEITPDMAEICNACGACERMCTQKLPIIERLREISEMRE